ncbi:MAG: hypothetical protein KDJ12_09985, partial [Hyphomicrobiales bacterium]|nr:hypothetical protein [Hyphomicrobiales bacterium]
MSSIPVRGPYVHSTRGPPAAQCAPAHRAWRAAGVGSRAVEGDFVMTAARLLAILAALAISAYVAL